MKEVLPKELQPNFPIQLRTDAIAGRGVCNRLGPGKIRHLEIRNLWLQDLVERRLMTVTHVKGEDNPADLLTKGVAKPVLERLRPRLQLEAWNPNTVAVCTVRGTKSSFRARNSFSAVRGECEGGFLQGHSRRMVQHGLVGGLTERRGCAVMFSTSGELVFRMAKRDESSSTRTKTVGAPSCFPEFSCGAGPCFSSELVPGS